MSSDRRRHEDRHHGRGRPNGPRTDPRDRRRTRLRISGATETPGSSVLGKDIGELAGLDHLGIAVSSDAAAVIAAADAIVDFTVPKASVEFARLAANSGTAAIIGTTGFDAESNAAIAEAAKMTPIVKAGNMSLGLNLLQAHDAPGGRRARERLRHRNR